MHLRFAFIVLIYGLKWLDVVFLSINFIVPTLLLSLYGYDVCVAVDFVNNKKRSHYVVEIILFDYYYYYIFVVYISFILIVAFDLRYFITVS